MASIWAGLHWSRRVRSERPGDVGYRQPAERLPARSPVSCPTAVRSKKAGRQNTSPDAGEPVPVQGLALRIERIWDAHPAEIPSEPSAPDHRRVPRAARSIDRIGGFGKSASITSTGSGSASGASIPLRAMNSSIWLRILAEPSSPRRTCSRGLQFRRAHPRKRLTALQNDVPATSPSPGSANKSAARPPRPPGRRSRRGRTARNGGSGPSCR